MTMTVTRGTIRVVAGMTCSGRMGGAKLDAGVRSEFLGTRNGLMSTASSSNVLVLASVAVEISSVKPCLDFAAARLAFFRADFEGDSLIFSERAMFSIFFFNNRFS